MRLAMWLCSICVASALSPACIADTPQQEAMRKCNQDATNKKGDERKAFMRNCLAKGSGQISIEKLCAEPSSQDDEEGCAHYQVDKDLNAAYQDALRQLKANDQADMVQPLVEAQRAWIKFRDSHCAFIASVEGWGGREWSNRQASCSDEEAVSRTLYLNTIFTPK